MISVRKWFIGTLLFLYLHNAAAGPPAGPPGGLPIGPREGPGDLPIDPQEVPVLRGDDPTPPPNKPDNNQANQDNQNAVTVLPINQRMSFIAPDEDRSVDDVDVFVHDHQHEYLVVDRDLTWFEANITCMRLFNARLADFEKYEELGNWMAEALSETDLKVDSLWTSGTKQEGEEEEWYWIIRHNKQAKIDDAVVKNLSFVEEINSTDRLCVAFARLDHDQPDYRKLTCQAKRGALCVRAEGGGHGNSTHPGWIKLGSRHYKIFGGPITYDEADRQCYRSSEDSQLAVIRNFKVSQFLGRYLLVGRPSLENAWIGARWRNADNNYVFEAETVILAEIPKQLKNGGRWPPWRANRKLKPNGCVLLDRHLANQTLFVEARCERKRGYICYKTAIIDGSKNDSTDVIIDSFGYRLHYAMKTWFVAKTICDNHNFSEGLVEVSNKTIKNHILYIMGENRTAMQHLWIAGQFNPHDGKWSWHYSKQVVPNDDSVLDWVVNDTYNAEVESDNICLNMDRENHIKGLFYGTRCNALQMFICSFTKENLKRQIQMEKEALGHSDYDYLDSSDDLDNSDDGQKTDETTTTTVASPAT